MKIAIVCGLVIMVGTGWLALRLNASEGTRRPIRRHAATLAWLVSLTVVLLASALQDRSVVVPVAQSRTSAAHSLTEVRALVEASNQIVKIPIDLTPPASWAAFSPGQNFGGPPPSRHCGDGVAASVERRCAFGVTNSARTVILYGDSHAMMWFQALDEIANHDGWRLDALTKPACPAAIVSVHPLGRLGDDMACDRWHRSAVTRINKIRPTLLIVTEETYRKPDGGFYTPEQWQEGLGRLLGSVHATRTVVLGNTPMTGGPQCLVRTRDVQLCSGTENTSYNSAERRAAQHSGAAYVDVAPWFCAQACSPVIGNMDVYFDAEHVAVGYTMFLEGVLAPAVGM